MKIHFTKMHGCGNDYVYINGFTEKIPQQDKSELVRRLSDRHFGIGGDGVIFINPSENADFEMEMYNMDGSRGEMCGNGIRCVGKYVYDHHMTDKAEISVESFGKIKYLTMTVKDGKVEKVKVNMGAPILEAEQIPVEADASPVVAAPIAAQGQQLQMTCVSMGNPHAVFFVEDTENMDLTGIGPALECHERFPRRTNVEFVQVIDKGHVRMRVWERGTGETLACGTGCCATCVACVLNGLTDDKVTVDVLGGTLEIFWDREENLVYMTGPATTVFDGEIEV